MRKITYYFTALLFVMCMNLQAQEDTQEKKRYKIHTIGFYNLENLFDTINDPNKFDEASPIMEMRADRQEVYKKKVHNMARVIADIGRETAHNSPVVLGVSE